MAIKPLNQKHPRIFLHRALWLAAFAVFLALSILSAAYQIGKSKVEDVRAQNGYCFLLAQEPGYLYPGPRWTLWAVTSDEWPVFDVKMTLFERPKTGESNSDFASKWQKRIEMSLGTLPRNAYEDVHNSILPGAYQVDIQTRYNRFTETFEIWPNADKGALHKWHGHIEVRHFPDGKLVRPPMSF
jgi:hypothetical protein